MCACSGLGFRLFGAQHEPHNNQGSNGKQCRLYVVTCYTPAKQDCDMEL